jgi:hypothetical protein
MNRLLSGLLSVLSFLSSEIALASTAVSWNGTSYDIPAAGETGWENLSNFLIALGNNAGVTNVMKQAVRVATTTPVTVSDTTDCVVAIKLASAGAVAVNLPAGTNGRWFAIVDQTGDAATNNITINRAGSDTINGSTTLVLDQNNEGVILVYSSTNTRWNVVGRFTSGAPLTNPMAVTGDMIYSVGTVPTKLATGATAGLLHGGNGAVPSWSAVVSADITDATIVNADINGSAAIAYSKLNLATSILNADVNASAAIAYSKLASMSTGQILLGNAGTPTATTLSGDVTVGATGVAAIGTGVIVNADVNASAAIAYSKLNLSGSLVAADVNTDIPRTCSRRTSACASCGVSNCVCERTVCSAGEIIMGGGCSTSAAAVFDSGYPLTTTTYHCQYTSASGSTITTYAICCVY